LRDFTLSAYKALIASLEDKGYKFCTFEQLHGGPNSRIVILRHDVDKNPGRALQMATFESSRSIRASYHIRVLPGQSSISDDTVKKLVALGHEVAYHYEDLSRAYRDNKYFRNNKEKRPDNKTCVEQAKRSFKDNLAYLRQFYPVKVISMHGDPGSSIDNRKLWEYLSYRDMGVICEPYLDIDYNKTLYLTDTGRRWDAGSSNIRDRVYNGNAGNKYMKDLSLSSRTTFDVINRIRNNSFPETVIINTHPQRWTDHIMPWITELLLQNFKNIIKTYFFNHRQYIKE